MKPVIRILLLILSVFLIASWVGAAEETPATEAEEVVVSTGSGTVSDEGAVSESVDATSASSQCEDEKTGGQSAATIEKPAAVQTASWGEIKRKFKDQ